MTISCPCSNLAYSKKATFILKYDIMDRVHKEATTKHLNNEIDSQQTDKFIQFLAIIP